MQILYTKNTLSINICDLPTSYIKENGDVCFLYNNNQLIGINIYNLPSEFNLSPGLIYPSQELIKFIEDKTKIKFEKEINFVVGEVKLCEDIPDSHLHKCVVSDGNNDYDIVCGASNVKANIRIVLAKANTIMPNGKRIIPGKLMGYISNGMICSAKELKLPSQDEKGILILNDNYKVGEEFKSFYKNL